MKKPDWKVHKKAPTYHIGRPILPVDDYPCEVLSGFRRFRHARACCFWMKSDPSIQTWLSVMLDSRLAKGQVSLDMKPAPKHLITVNNCKSPFLKPCEAWSKEPTGSKIYGLSRRQHSVLKGLRKTVKWLDGSDDIRSTGWHAMVVASPVPLIGAISMVLYIYWTVFGALSKLGVSYIDLPRSIKWRAFSIYVAVIGFSLIPVLGAGPIKVSKPSRRVLYMVEGYLSLRSAVLWHEATEPGKLAEELGYAMRGRSEGSKATGADLSTAKALVDFFIGKIRLASVQTRRRGFVDLEKG